MLRAAGFLLWEIIDVLCVLLFADLDLDLISMGSVGICPEPRVVMGGHRAGYPMMTSVWTESKLLEVAQRP